LILILIKSLTTDLIEHNKWIILDRDGVINYDSQDYIKAPAEWVAIPGALESIAKLNASGYKVIIVSNQSAVGRGMITSEIAEAIHAKLISELASFGGHIQKAYYCFHTPEDKCLCRKPLIGLLQEAMSDWSIKSFASIPLLGDKSSDMQLAINLAAIPIHIQNPMYTINPLELAKVFKSFVSLEAFTEDWLN
jgi:D-glycero-D-manno-heptose 1,7-bisphosphate phosphatase